MSQQPPPGWYPDPHDPGQQRYWDGKAWTEHTAPVSAAPPEADGVAPPPSVPSSPAPSPNRPDSSTPSAGLVGWIKRHKVASGVIAFIVLVLVVAALSPPDVATEAASSPTIAPSASAPTTDPTTSSPAEQPSPSEAPSSTSTPEPTPKPTSYAGSGDKIISIKKPTGDPGEPVAATISYSGGSNFVVWTLNRNLKEDQLLVNTIGSYQGTVAMDFEKGQATTRLKVESAGPWKVILKPLESLKRFSNSIRGKGDDVVIYQGSAGVANITYRGNSNFVVWYYGNGDLLVNEIGNYKGQQVIDDGPGVVTVEADGGEWSISVK